MILSSSPAATDRNYKPKTNWPIVGLLFFLAGVPGLPAIFILATVAIGPPADGSVHSFVNMLHFTMPAPVIVHGGAGVLFFFSMPLQFSPALRARHKNWHRAAGYLTIISGYVIACSAPWLHQVFSPDSGLPRLSGLLTMSVGMIIAFSLSLRAAIARNIKHHRAWMMRAVAITLGPITSALIAILISTTFGDLDKLYPGLGQLEVDYARWFGMTVNLMVVEYVLLKGNAANSQVGLRAIR